MTMHQNTRELQKMSITICREARTTVTEALRASGIDVTRLIPGSTQRDHVSIELCLTGPQAARVIDTILPAVTLRARGCSNEVVITSLDPNTGPQPCCKQDSAAPDRGETPYATE